MHTGRHVTFAVALLLGVGACTEERAAPPPPPDATTPPAATTAPANPVAPAPPDIASDRAPRSPSAPPAPPASPASPAPGDDQTVAKFLGYTAPKPAVWLWHPPETRMRAANYVVPGRSGADQAHVVVFSGIGGGKQANIDRWRGQFRATDHTAVEAHITELEADGVPITLVELQGERMKMGEGWYSPNQLLLAAIVHDPGGDIHIMFQGQHETVHANRDAFMKFIEGLRRKGDG